MAGKRVLITGGSRGIGKAMVRAFCEQGDLVAFTYQRNEEQAKQLMKETGALGVCCDVRSEDAVAKMKSDVLSKFHSLDILVSNAGISSKGLLEDMDVSEWDNMFAVHVRGAFLVTRAFLQTLRDKHGAIVYVSSMWGQTGGSCETAYSASKAALIGLTKALAKEVAPSVRVNCIAPGVIDTDMMKEYSDQDKQVLIELTPLSRIGTPQDVANAAVFLCSENASFITGQVLGVNGGIFL